MRAQFNERVAVITGGNSGIGRAIAFALAEAGFRLVVSGRREKENQKAVEEIRSRTGAEAFPVSADVSREEDCRHLIKETVRRMGRLDILVNNAGIWGGDAVENTDTQTFDQVMRTNLYGPFWCSREAFRVLKENPVDPESGLRGSILHISSLAGKESWAGQATYSASKFGLMALNQALADEGRAAGIRSAAICPALVATPMTGVSGKDYLVPEDVARTVLYLLNLSAAAWPTEVVLPRRGAD